MRLDCSRRVFALAATSLVLTQIGAGPGSKKISQLAKEKPVKTDEMVGSLGSVHGSDDIRVEGVGLVIGLNNTGSNPEPSAWRNELLDKMKKAQVPNPEKLLESATTSLVIVRGTIPAGITTKDSFDIDIELTPASTTTSLEGGHLIRADLKVTQIVDGQRLNGKVLATAGGTIVIGSVKDPKNPKVGRILGGAKATKDVPYRFVLTPERAGFRSAAMVAAAINRRFFTRKGVEQIGMAEAEQPELIDLKVPTVYHHNQYRYFQVVQHLPIYDTPPLRAMRQERWAKELLDPKTSGEAALCLEAIGRNAIPTLKTGLESSNKQVQFFAAESLAYLNDPSGAEVLARTVKEQPEFRAFALAALAAMDHSASVLRLRELLAEADPKIRYGAFNSLRILDEQDSSLGHVRLLRDKEEEDPDDAMALRSGALHRRREPRPDDPFDLYVVDCDGPPMIHVTRSRRSEIVLFGARQRLSPPVVLGGTGPILLNASDQDNHIQITRIGGEPGSELHSDCSTSLADVITSAANLGATYPEVVQILEAADRQKNLGGPLVFDSLPDAANTYDKAQMAGVDTTAKKDDSVKKTGADAKEDGKAGHNGLIQRLRDRIKR